MSHEADNPPLTVVVVSDHAGDEEKAWADLRETLEGLAAQEYAGQTATLYVESPDRIARIPREMKQILPALEIVEGPVSNSYSLKTAGMEAATTAAVAFLDADCVPAAGWLRAAASMTNKYPDAAVVVGKTEYGSARLSYRILSMLSRSTEDPGHDGETEHISANNAVYRRAAYLQSPLPANVAFFSRTHAVAVRKAGGKIYFDRAMHVHHKFAGWRHEADFRRRLGHGVIAMRQAYPDMPKSWLKRLGYASIPLFVGAQVRTGWRNCLRCGSAYGVRPHELPLAFLIAVVVAFMEVPGMVRAFGGRPVGKTAFR